MADKDQAQRSCGRHCVCRGSGLLETPPCNVARRRQCKRTLCYLALPRPVSENLAEVPGQIRLVAHSDGHGAAAAKPLCLCLHGDKGNGFS